MAGKRILDVAHLLNASRSVARSHVALRASQLDVYTKTSTLAKTVKNQTKAADAVARKPHENPSASGHQGGAAGTTVPAREDSGSPEQDHSYRALETTVIVDVVPQRDLKVRREKTVRYPPADGTILPDQDKDAFYAPSQTESETKSLFQQNATSAGGESPEPESSTIPEKALPDQTPYLEGINTDVFRSPRVANILAGNVQGKRKPGSLTLAAASGTSEVQRDIAESKNRNAFNVLEERGQELPADIAMDTTDLVAGAQSNLKFSTANPSPSPNANYQMRESRVPSSQLGRLWHYGGLATGMAFGAVGESVRRATGNGGDGGSLILSGGNMERLVSKLSRMRGAALKLGQMISFQDSKLLPGPIQEVLQRVQDSADYMPATQRDRVLTSNLGSDWRDLFSSFDEVPMAAASIGQVHGAILRSTGQRVAVKVQYPGVADSIDSDLDNLSILLTASRLLPKGLYLEKTIANARTELAWECDYEREAQCGRRFRELLKGDDVFVVPEVIGEASGKQVLTMERMDGIGVTKVKNLSQEQKDW
ncbi:hypothetical protein GP486_004804, partial [Trichoglossum hirsutum]